ncbi:hypothetical protein RJO18_002697 [Enterobacter hormaechei]|nr:hypothetical protein [Enterobacter hormaechei]ELC6478305.1 hypothetical protein [Enterobacter hormaechei]
MATQPTNLPVPSESYRDLKYNAGKIDEFVTSLTLQYIDRFGNAHYTIEGLRWLAQQAIAQYGWIPVGTFQDGATLTLPNQILKDTTDGAYYRWDGVLPKTVPSGSTPSTSGGTGVGAWLSVGDSTLRAMLAAPGGDKHIGSSWGGGSVWEDYAPKKKVFLGVRLLPTMSQADIQSALQAGGNIYFDVTEDGLTTDYVLNTGYNLYENTRIYFHPKAKLVANANNIIMLNADPSITLTGYVRNLKIFGFRLSFNNKTGVTGAKFVRCRNNSGIFNSWIDMGLGASCTGVLVSTLCYGFKNDGLEILNGGSGSLCCVYEDGANACLLDNYNMYSADPSGALPDYRILIRSTKDGSEGNGTTTFSTFSTMIGSGFIQNSERYGILDNGAYGTMIGNNVYFEGNKINDVRLSGSKGAVVDGTHHSTELGAACVGARNTVGCVIRDTQLRGSRSTGYYDIDTSNTDCYIDYHRDTGISSLGVVTGAIVNRATGRVASVVLPASINLRSGNNIFYVNVVNNDNISVSGSTYNGMTIDIIVRGANLTNVTFAGLPLDMTAANTAVIKTTRVTATYINAIGNWVLSHNRWLAVG